MYSSGGRVLRKGSKSHDAPFHYSPAIAPEDVICGGSDTEETEDEIRRKHLRYEEQARRYMSGNLPVLQSVLLRGPLTTESGWVNPWRYQKPEKETWWRPGAKDMMFRKQDVMKRAADHGLGHLNPAEALAWCKSTAAAEARAASNARSGWRAFDLKSSPMSEDSAGLSSHSDEEERLLEQAGIPDEKVTPYGYTEQKAENGMGFRDVEESIRGTKRLVDPKWLKGSYVSKRARWEGPALSTPTPMPDPHNERDRRRQSKLKELGRSLPAARSRSSLQDQLQAGALELSEEVVPANTLSSRCHSKQRTSSMKPSSIPDAQPRTSHINQSVIRQQGVGYMDEFHESSTLRFEQDSRLGFFKTTYGTETISKTSLEMGLVPSSPPSRKRHIQTPATHSENGQASSAATFPSALPKLPRHTETPECQKSMLDSSEEDVSFVTEVAPSSRNLEKFQFRKKRTKPRQIATVQPEEFDEPISVKVLVARKPSEDNNYQIQNVCAPQSDDLKYVSYSNTDIATPLAAQSANPPISEKFTSHCEEKGDMSLLQTPLSPRVQAAPPLLPEFANFGYLFSQGGLGIESPESGMAAPVLQQGSIPSTKSGHPMPLNASPRPPISIVKSPLPILQRNLNTSTKSRQALPSHTLFEPPTSTAKPLVPVLHQSPNIIALPSLALAGPTISIAKSPAPILQQSSSSSAGSSQALPLHTLRWPPAKTVKSPVPVDASPNRSKGLRLYDSSTQSYNTTPVRSGRSIKSSQKPITQSQVREEVDILVEEVPSEIEDEDALVDNEMTFRGDVDEVDANARDDGDLNGAIGRQHILDEQLLNQQVPEQQVLDLQLHPEVPSDETPLEQVRIDYVAVEQNQPEYDNEEEIIDESDGRKASPEYNIDEDETASEDTSDEETDDLDLESPEDDTRSNSDRSSEGLLHVSSTGSKNDTLSGNATHKLMSSQAANAESPFQPPSHVEAIDTEATRPMIPEAKVPKTPEVASQVIRPGEQTPWTKVAIGVFPKPKFLALVEPSKDDASTSPYETVPRPEENGVPRTGSDVDERSWQHIERSLSPDEDAIIPFRDIMTPPTPQKRRKSIENLPSTQLLVEAALSNPWTSKKTASGKFKKRVSFGVLPSETDEMDEATPLPKRIPASPPPPEPVELFEEDSSDESTILVTFGDHFSAARKQRLIPECTDSQINRSPAVVAQAQAFLAADQQAPMEQEDHRTLAAEPSHHLNLGDEAMDHAVWQYSEGADSPLKQSQFIGTKSDLTVFNPPMPTFDMDDVLGDAENFLEDWSVDAELKKAKDIDSGKGIESNGAKRRRLFGIV